MTSSVPISTASNHADRVSGVDRAVAMRRLALFTFFFLPGFAIASWITRMPVIRDNIGASIAEMGMVLFGLSVGAMTGLLAAGAIVGRIGTRPLAAFGMWAVVGSMMTIAAGSWFGFALPVAFGLLLFGIGMGSAEIAINIEGADVEQITGRPLLHALHGFFSFGTVCGALAGLTASSLALPPHWHLITIGLVCAAAVPILIRYIPSGVGLTRPGETVAAQDDNRDGVEQGSSAIGSIVFGKANLAILCLVVLAMAFAEGAAYDWLPILMVDEFAFSEASGSLVFLVFAIAMTIIRFTGGYALTRFGRPAMIAASAVVVALGLAIITTTASPIAAGAAVLLWGVGASLYFPAALSIAGDSGPDGVRSVKQVALVGYSALLVGPPMLGFIGHEFGLRGALTFVMMLVILAIPAAVFTARVSKTA